MTKPRLKLVMPGTSEADPGTISVQQYQAASQVPV